jgi:hypothetical protein
MSRRQKGFTLIAAEKFPQLIVCGHHGVMPKRPTALVLQGYWCRSARPSQSRVRLRMFAAMLFAISIVALFQFALFYWRAVLAGVAAQPVSDRVLAAASVEDGRLTSQDFEVLAGLHDLTPELCSGGGGLRLVRLYFRFVRNLDTLVGSRMPAFATWCERERTICARYAAVRVERRLQVNLALAASLRSC